MCFKRYKIKSLTKKINTLQKSRAHNQATDAALAKEIAYYHQLAKVYRKLKGNKKFPFAEQMAWEALRAAANLEDNAARYEFGKYLLEFAKFREKLSQESLFNSQSNERQMKQLYEEALAYLEAARSDGHALAERLEGLCYINGWGVGRDQNKGFDLVVSSIARENTWDKVPQIFAEIGLNKPEFFEMLTRKRHQA